MGRWVVICCQLSPNPQLPFLAASQKTTSVPCLPPGSRSDISDTLKLLHCRNSVLSGTEYRSTLTVKLYTSLSPGLIPLENTCRQFSVCYQARKFFYGFVRKVLSFRPWTLSIANDPALAHPGSSLQIRKDIQYSQLEYSGVFSCSTVAKINSPWDRVKKITNRVSYALIAAFLSSFPGACLLHSPSRKGSACWVCLCILFRI